MKKKKIMFLLLTTNEINTRWVKGLSVKPHTSKLLKENRRIYLCILGRQGLLKQNIKCTNHKRKSLINLTTFKTKNFCKKSHKIKVNTIHRVGDVLHI